MLIALTMPQFGESITQARVVHWLKNEGDEVKEAEPLVEMETEKSIFSYESPFRGKLLKILEKEDVEVQVGTSIAHFEVSDEDGKKYLSLGIGKVLSASTPAAEPGKKMSPLLRSLAKKEHEKEGVKVIPLTAIRSRIAEKMVLSKQTIPHAGCSIEVDLHEIQKWRSAQGKKAPSYLLFTMMAALKALKDNPVINSSWKEEGAKKWLEQYEFVNLGVAMATDQGLIVPVIRGAEKKKFSELSQELVRLIEAGRKGTLSVQELTGGTFSINNSGALGAVRSEQIIPYPQAAIMAVNRVIRRPWAVGDAIEIRPIMGLDLAFDHRIIDGDLAVKFLASVRDHLETFDFSEISS